MWAHGGASGMDKRQCTVQLTVFTDGEPRVKPRVKPLIIFKGTSTRLPLYERVSKDKTKYIHSYHKCFFFYLQVHYDSRLTVVFQQKVWCDEPVILGWIRPQWTRACQGNMLLVIDAHKAQKLRLCRLS